MTSKLSLIERLLAKAESTTPEEAEALTDAAQKLMIKHGVDAAMIAAHKAKNSAPEPIKRVTVRIKGSYRRGVMSMMASVANALPAIRIFKRRGKEDGADVIELVGFESDVDQAKLLLESLHLQAISAMSKWWRNAPERSYLTGQPATTARRQFIISFGVGAAERIRSMTSEVVNAEPGNAIALRDRSGDVDAWVAAQMGPIRYGKSHMKGSLHGNAEGRAAGRVANTGGTQVGTGVRGSLS